MISLKERWKKNWPWGKKLFFHIMLPSFVWGALIALTLNFLSDSPYEEPIIYLFMVGFYTIWIVGFHRGRFLTKENPQNVGFHIIYAFTLVHLGMFLSIQFFLVLMAK